MNPDMRDRYHQGLSKVNWYMKQHRSKYGCILTNRELVVLRRRDDNGNLEVSEQSLSLLVVQRKKSEMTVLLALWYPGMLAAQEHADCRHM